MEFGVGAGATSNEGVMGVGFENNEAIVQVPGAQPYPNLVDQMVSEKLIQARAYSLYLDDIDASTGSILFGGVDTEKFQGTLSTFPINVDINGDVSQFVISATGLSLTTQNGNSIGIGASRLFPFNALLDSGSSFMSLPEGIVTALADEFSATFSQEIGAYVLPNCDSQFAKGYLTFFFSGVQISIPYDEFIINPMNSDGTIATLRDGSPLCVLGVIPSTRSDQGVAVLGDTFLRSAYIVYDLVTSPNKYNF